MARLYLDERKLREIGFDEPMIRTLRKLTEFVEAQEAIEAAEGDIADLDTGKQNADATLTALAALDATAGRVRRDVLGRAFGVTSVGAAVGIAGALASSRLFSSLLFEVSPTDPITLAGVCALLVGVGGAAAYLPARRATKVDPARALRAD